MLVDQDISLITLQSNVFHAHLTVKLALLLNTVLSVFKDINLMKEPVSNLLNFAVLTNLIIKDNVSMHAHKELMDNLENVREFVWIQIPMNTIEFVSETAQLL